MKNLMIIATVLLPMIASAQIGKGRSFTGGQLSYQLRSTPAYKANVLGISANYGYLFTNKWAGGFTLSYRFNKQNYVNNIDDYTKRYSAGLFARRYFLVTDKLYFTLDGGAAAVYRDSRTGSNPALPIGSRSTELLLTVTPGATYFVTRRFAVQASLGQISFQAPFNESYRAIEFDTSLSVLSLGVELYFR